MPHRLARHPDFLRHVFRGFVLADHRAPHLTLAEQRQHQLGTHAEIEVVPVAHRRGAAQRGIAEIERPAGVREQRHGRIGDIGLIPDPHQRKHAPCRSGHVAGRKVQAEETAQIVAPGLGQNVPGAVGQKFISQHPVVAGDVPDGSHRDIQHPDQIPGAPQFRDTGPHLRVKSRSGGVALRDGLELQHKQVIASVREDFVTAAGRCDGAEMHGRRRRVQFADPAIEPHRLFRQDIRERPAQEFRDAACQTVRVSARGPDPPARFLHSQQNSVRLNRFTELNRLPVAGTQIDCHRSLRHAPSPARTPLVRPAPRRRPASSQWPRRYPPRS